NACSSRRSAALTYRRPAPVPRVPRRASASRAERRRAACRRRYTAYVNIATVADPILDRDSLDECLRLVAREAVEYLAGVDEALVRPAGTPDGMAGPLPDEGTGSLAALRTLVEAAQVGATRSAGPRFFHFV